MNKIIKNIFIIFFYLLLISFLFKNSFGYLDPDFGWHIRVGQDIYITRDIPSINTYNFSLYGMSWVDHEWLFNLFFYLVYNFLGYFYLTTFFVLMVVLTVFLLKKLSAIVFGDKVSNEGKGEYNFYFYSLAFFGVFASSPHLGVRMQELTLLLMVLVLYCLLKFEKQNNIAYLYILPPIYYFWAMLHGSFLIGFFILGVYGFTKIIAPFLSKFSFFRTYFESGRNLTKKELVKIFFIFFLSFLVTFITPYGISLYGILWDYSSSYYLKHIQEWLPIYYYPLFINKIYYIAIFVSFVFFVYYAVSKEGKKIKSNFFLSVLSLIFVFLSIKSKRHFPLFFVVSLPLLSFWVYEVLKVHTTNLKFLTTSKIVKFYLFVVMLLLSINFFVKTNYNSTPFESYCNKYPCKAVEFIRNNPDLENKNLLNVFHWGGFLTWVMPEKLIFIDGRFPIYKIGGVTFLEEYHNFFNEEKVEDKLNEYNIESILFMRGKESRYTWYDDTLFNIENIEAATKNELRDYLSTRNDWEKIYEDEISYIYSKKKSL